MSRDELTRMTDLQVKPLARWEDGYSTCHLEVALVLPKLSMYGSCKSKMSHSLWSGALIKSNWALSDLLRFCCQILSLVGSGARVYDIKGTRCQANLQARSLDQNPPMPPAALVHPYEPQQAAHRCFGLACLQGRVRVGCLHGAAAGSAGIVMWIVDRSL